MLLKPAIDILFLLAFLLSFTLSPFGLNPVDNVDKKARVYIEREGKTFTLIRNGQPFHINGAAGNGPLRSLAALGANTIRIYDTLDLLRVLNEANELGIAVIVDIPILPYHPQYNYYENEDDNLRYISRVRNLVEKHKSHPALLMWNLGNEVNYPQTIFKNDFILTFNRLVDIIKKEDPDHPVGTVLTFPSKRELLSIALHSPELEFIGFNVFGNIKNIEKQMATTRLFMTPFPFYFGEWAHDGPWEALRTHWAAPVEPTSTKKMEQLRERHQLLKEQGKGQSLGALAFYWGAKLEATPTWFSTFYHDSLKSEVIRTMESLWKSEGKREEEIGLNYMLLDESGAASSLIFSPGEKRMARLVFHDKRKDSLSIQWELHKESWDSRTWGEEGKSQPINSSILQSTGDTVELQIPREEGPYRLFVFVCDSSGYCATANTPFYVMKETNGI